MIKLINGVKILTAAILAILIAEFLNLDFTISAGIVAILSVQPTKKETLNTAFSRFYAFIIALFIFFISSRFFGCTIYAFFLYLIPFIFICQIFKWYAAMAMDSVLISHFVSLNAFGIRELKNELLLFVIGVGFGVLVNLFLHKKTDKIEILKNEADEQIRKILYKMSEKILNLNFSDYNDDCFTRLNLAILEAKIFAKENADNQFRKADKFDEKYIEMRESQKEILHEIYKYIIELKTVPSTAQRVSDFFKKVALEYEKENDVIALIDELNVIHTEMKQTKLPETRPEFEDRAILFMILKRMNEFLVLKRNFYKAYMAL